MTVEARLMNHRLAQATLDVSVVMAVEDDGTVTFTRENLKRWALDAVEEAEHETFESPIDKTYPLRLKRWTVKTHLE